MITPLLLIVVVAVVLILIAPGERFLTGFTPLLAEPAIQRGPLSFFSGRSYATGRFEDRRVAIRLQLKRSRYGQGYLVLAMRTEGQPALTDSGIDARIDDDAGRRALSAIASQGLVLGVEDSWLKAWWRPQGLVIFPGRFSEARWREVLEALQTIARALEASGPAFTPESAVVA